MASCVRTRRRTSSRRWPARNNCELVSTSSVESLGAVNPTLTGRRQGGLHSIAYAHLAKDLLDVRLHRVLTEVHATSDLAIGGTLAHQAQDCELTLIEIRAIQPGRFWFGTYEFEDLGRDHRGDRAGAATDRADALLETETFDVLEHVAHGAGLDALLDEIGVGEGRDHQD